MTQLVFAQTDPPFWVLTDTNGDGVEGVTFIAGDVEMSTWDDSTDTYTNAVNIGLECSEGDNGFYYWKPLLPAQMQHSVILLKIHDSAQTRFVENRVIAYIGGDPAKVNSRYRG